MISLKRQQLSGESCLKSDKKKTTVERKEEPAIGVNNIIKVKKKIQKHPLWRCCADDAMRRNVTAFPNVKMTVLSTWWDKHHTLRMERWQNGKKLKRREKMVAALPVNYKVSLSLKAKKKKTKKNVGHGRLLFSKLSHRHCLLVLFVIFFFVFVSFCCKKVALQANHHSLST